MKIQHFQICFLSCFILVILTISACKEPLSSDADENPSVVQKILHEEVTIGEILSAYESGEITMVDVTQYYISRIEKVDRSGPSINAVRMINPDALEIAKKLQEEYDNGKQRGPLHGIPILLKDNIDTKDKMPTTAGARAMENSYPLNDSPLAAQLRDAGAIILGKANLSEWANFHSDYSSSGWSGLGGQVKNPFELDRNPCGSSAGSGAAVNANLCVVAIGTETNGSIVCPANNNGVVGIKPTVGLISRSGIIPISFTQDTGGPMARSVKDAVICLGTLTAEDSKDEKTTQVNRKALTDYTPFLKLDGLKGKRIGYYKRALGNHVRMTKVMEQAVEDFRNKGAEIIEVNDLLPNGTNGHSFQVLLFEFKDGLNKYFTSLGAEAVIKNMDELIEKTFSDSIEMKYFDHSLLKMANEKGDLNSEEYKTALKTMLENSRKNGIDKVMDENNLDAIIAPTGGPAWKTDLTNGDRFGIFSSSPAAIAGYPNITVPMGALDGLPVGVSIFGRAWSESTLIEVAYAYEQATKHRMTPQYLE